MFTRPNAQDKYSSTTSGMDDTDKDSSNNEV